MRAGWVKKHLGEVCESKLGKTLNASTDHGEIRPYLCAVNVKWDAFDLATIKKAPFDADEIKKYSVQKGDLLVCEGGETGRAAIWDKEEPIQYQNALHRIRFKEGTILPRFCLHYLRYLKLSGVLDKEYSHGATILHLVSKSLYSIPIEYPSLPEQQRIVDILDREFAKIDALKANAEKSLQAANDLFQATTDTMMSNGQWRELTIGEIAKIKGGKRVPKGYKLEKEPTAHRYIRVADFTDLGTIRTESVLYISDEVYKSIKAYTISSKDVYISIAGTIGKSGIIPDTLDGANLTENACKLVLGPNFYNRFVFFATKTSSFKKQVETLTMQAAQPKLALTRLATIRVRVPSSIKEQETIVERLDGIADTIALLQENYQKTLSLCDDLKQSLLRKAFNGEL